MRETRTGLASTAAGATSLTAAGTFISGPRSIAGTRTFHQVLKGTGALTSAYTIDASNDGGNTWINIYTNATFNGSNSVADGFAELQNHNWDMYRVNLTAITGTGATFTSYVCEQVTGES